MFDRRSLLAAGAVGMAASLAPRLAFAAAPTDRRFVFIIQRGAADGLAILAPTGDPYLDALRGPWAATTAQGQMLDSFFTLHPMLSGVARLYGEGQALFAHATASPYRDRSHFDGQNVLESGGSQPYGLRDGWLNRLLSLLPTTQARALAVSATVPMALRGANEVGSYAPSRLPDSSDDLLERVSRLYAGDAVLHGLWSSALQTRQLTGDLAANQGRDSAATGTLVANLLSPANGARIAMVETGGWDTHSAQQGRLSAQLKGLDAMIDALRLGLGAHWQSTAVLVATEFGRTAAINGTGGTDHGTGAMAMLMGGAVRGGRMLSDWPGLAPSNLYEGRDLKPTMDVRALISGAIAGHFALAPDRVNTALFPEANGFRPLDGLIRRS
jgi:uncharacterized protein (DUF1501 family)